MLVPMHVHDVLSTHVEVVRSTKRSTGVETSALHARGGGPLAHLATPWFDVCSPRTWRWSAWSVAGGRKGEVLSTHVEVVRERPSPRTPGLRALHARGGGPCLPHAHGGGPACSPRTWRWSAHVVGGGFGCVVLSTHVEVVRKHHVRGPRPHRALHARGGGPALIAEYGRPDLVLSTHVEVVRHHPLMPTRQAGALHARGGGPRMRRRRLSRPRCSPRTWRWSDGSFWEGRGRYVLSTHVEVVRRWTRSTGTGASALHARGGGPSTHEPEPETTRCSPRTWRWSALVVPDRRVLRVLSTHVEVVRSL